MKQAESDNDGPSPSNAFLQVLQQHGGGEVCNELAEAMRACVEAVGLTGKPATLTLTAKFVPAAKAAYGVTFAPPKIKVPVGERYASLWFADDEGNLHRTDPRNPELPLKTMAKAAEPEARKAANN